MDELDNLIDRTDEELTATELHLQMRPPHVGAQVSYVLSSGRSKGEVRPAFIVRDWATPDGRVNLQVLTDATNDFALSEIGSNGILWATSAHYSATKEPHTWHWSEQG